MRKTGLRFGIVLLILSMLTGTAGFAAEIESFSAEEIPVQDCCGLLQEAAEVSLPEEYLQTPTLLSNGGKTFDQTLNEGCLLRAEFINVLQYRITVAQMRTLYYQFSMLHPELFIATSYSYVRESALYPDGSDDVIAYVAPIYLCSLEELPARQDKLRQSIASYTEPASQYPTDLEKILFVHDKLAIRCAYDTVAENKTNNGTLTDADYISFHADGLFTNGTAVCQGYAQAFFAISAAMGYEVNYCYNNGHIWNYIKLDGKWYHLDVTWDDPTPDLPNTAAHTYFLRSDAAMSDHAPAQWVSPLGTLPACDSTKYQSGYFFNFPGQKMIEKTEDGYYQFNYDFKNNKGEVVLSTAFYTQRLKTDIISSRPRQDGIVYYGYLRELSAPPTIFTQYQNAKDVCVSINTGSSLPFATITSNGQSYPIYTYTLPEEPADAASGKLFFWNMDTLTPCGPALAF